MAAILPDKAVSAPCQAGQRPAYDARLPGRYPLLAELAGYAEPGSDRWCNVQ